MRLLITSILFVFLNSCGTTQRDGWQLASEFHSNYANEFIQNTELLKYSYGPRMQFYYNPIHDKQTFRCWYHNSKLSVFNFGGFNIFQEEFQLKLDTLFAFKNIEFYHNQSELRLMVNDSIQVKIISFSSDPINYFEQLREQINEYGIVTYGKLRIGGIVEVYLTAYDYLLYFPTNLKIDEPQFEEHWRNKQKQGKQLDSNWFYYRSNKPLDFG
ncbi:MAG: hypothetical protein CMP48_27345 [Rickettsiales bacterium]|nr:hypothetical protein [Rickettsiales bacterium]